MAETNPDRSLKTQTGLLQAAICLARQKGWKNTKIQDICAEAGVSVGAFYHHFASKQELINRAFLIFDEKINELLSVDSTHPVEAIKEVLILQTGFIVREAGPLISEYYRNLFTDKRKWAANPERKYYQTVLGYVREAENLLMISYTPEYVTELLIKFVRGCIIDWCLHDYSYDLLERTSCEIDLLINSLFRSERR